MEEDFKNYLGVPYAEAACSGTAAFYLILESLKTLSHKKSVIIPSFVCPLLPLAIHRAGLKVKVCDINRDNFNFDISQLEKLCSQQDDILAIVAVHLGGIPVDLDSIKGVSKARGIFIIEDCAQSLGALYKDKKVGTLGDFSFFSLARGKGLTIYEGGIIATKNKGYAAILDRAMKKLVGKDILSEGLRSMELFGYWIFYRPSLFWFVYRLPRIYWDWLREPLKGASEYFTLDFPLHRVSKIRKSVGHASFFRLEEELNSQRQKIARYQEKLKETEGVKLITEPPQTKASYPYLTLMFSDPQKRKRCQDLFKNSGLGVSQVYLSAITDYAYLKGIIEKRDYPNARYLAEREITLTTSTFLNEADIETITNLIRRC